MYTIKFNAIAWEEVWARLNDEIKIITLYTIVIVLSLCFITLEKENLYFKSMNSQQRNVDEAEMHDLKLRL